MMKKRKCENCSKITKNIRFCSWKCFQESELVFQIRSKGGKAAQKTLRKRKVGAFHNPILRKEFQSKGGTSAKLVNAQSKAGKAAKLVNAQSKAGKIGGVNLHKKHPDHNKKVNIINKKNKTGIYSISTEQRRKIGKKSSETNRKNKSGPFFDLELNRLQRLNQTKKRGTYIFNKIHFDSISELEFGMNIHYQIEKLVERKNCQTVVGNKLFDFLIESLECFIEYHPWDRNGLSIEEYTKRRRKDLNENGYKNYKLVVIQ